MRRLFPLFAVLFLVPLLGSDSPKEYDERATVNPLEGTWRLTEIEYNGIKMKHNQCIVTYCGEACTSNYGDIGTIRGTYRIDTTQKPPHLDEIPSNPKEPCFTGETYKFIYQIDGDTLRIANLDDPKVRRPKGFNDKDLLIATYKRVK